MKCFTSFRRIFNAQCFSGTQTRTHEHVRATFFNDFFLDLFHDFVSIFSRFFYGTIGSNLNVEQHKRGSLISGRISR